MLNSMPENLQFILFFVAVILCLKFVFRKERAPSPDPEPEREKGKQGGPTGSAHSEGGRRYGGERTEGSNRHSRANKEREHSNDGQRRTGENSETNQETKLKEALELFEVQMPYSLAEIQKRRKQLLLKVHPDHGGSNALFRKVNEAYEILFDQVK